MAAFDCLAVLGALLGGMYIWLSVLVVRQRRLQKVALGLAERGGLGVRAVNPLDKAVRAHGNFIEYVPLALILLGFAVQKSAPLWVIAGCGVALLLGRVCHAYSLLCHEQYDGNGVLKNNPVFRIGGMVLTFAAIGGAAVWILWAVFCSDLGIGG